MTQEILNKIKQDIIVASDEELSLISRKSKNVVEITQAMIDCWRMVEALKSYHSNVVNRKRRFYEYMATTLNNRLKKINDQQQLMAKAKRLRRLETKVIEQTAVQTLVTKLIQVRGKYTKEGVNEVIAENNKSVASTIAATDDPQKDSAFAAIQAKALAAMQNGISAKDALKDIASGAKVEQEPAWAGLARQTRVEDEFQINPDGSVPEL